MAPSITSDTPTNPSKPSKLSKSGSGAHSKRTPNLDPNVLEVVFGTLLIKPWYPSFYPEDIVGRKVERLYVCQRCFKYSKELVGFLGHLKGCRRRDTASQEVEEGNGIDNGVAVEGEEDDGDGSGDESERGIPGEEIYRDEERGYSIWEIDGEDHKLYAQNLSLFAKLFLDTKSVFYDVTTFLYYVLVAHNPSPVINSGVGDAEEEGKVERQVVGFFSKEKMSWDNNNLACILVFPPWQKQGLGQILMGASYEMSKREGRLGGPEKPLSELGRRAYAHYWATTLSRVILSFPSKKTLSVLDLRNETYIVPEDIIATLQAMEVIDHKKRGNANAVINKAKVREWVEKHRVDLRSPVNPDGFVEYEEEEEENGEEVEE